MHKCRGVGIFIQDNMHCGTVHMDRYYIEKDIEICNSRVIPEYAMKEWGVDIHL